MHSPRPSRLKAGNVFATIPSVYGAATWLLGLSLYSLRLLPWYPPAFSSLVVLWICGFCFVVSTWVFYLPYRHWLTRLRRSVTVEELQRTTKGFTRTLLALHLIGLGGIVLYVYDFSLALGGLRRFFALLADQSYVIRWQAEYTRSAGTQLSYLGWPAMAITVALCMQGKLSRNWLSWVVLQFLGNCLFIGRTRPIWLLLTTALLLAPLASKLSMRRVLYRSVITGGLVLVVFIGMGVWVGKISADIVADRNSSLPATLQNFYLYLTAGFAYFDGILRDEVIQQFGFERSAYPLFRLFAIANVGPEPPSQINGFLWMPFPTNVGTALEPFYRDGGLAGAVAGMLVVTFGTDLLALWLWQTNRLLGWFAAANLCFSSALAFFTPKLNTLPIWIFVSMGILACLFARRTASQANRKDQTTVKEFWPDLVTMNEPSSPIRLRRTRA